MPESDKYKSFDDIKCIWMNCDAVEYKICDRNFDCDNCYFDRYMLSKTLVKRDVYTEIEKMFDLGQHTVSFTHPTYHFRSGLIARNFLHDNYYLGIEPYIAKFIDNHSSIKNCTSKEKVLKGEPVLNISNGWGELNVLSPFRFKFVERLDTNNIFSSDLHWFAMIKAERCDILSNSINDNDYFDKLYKSKSYLINLIENSSEMETLNPSKQAGITMYDGGEVLENWSLILGNQTYKSLLEHLFY